MKLDVHLLADYQAGAEPLFDADASQEQYELCRKGICASLEKIFAALSPSDVVNMPITVAIGSKSLPGTIKFFSLSHYRTDSFKFFFELLIHALLPGRRTNVVFLSAVDFRFAGHSTDVFTLCELMVKVENPAEVQTVWHHWPSLERQLKLGLESEFYSRRLLEIRGMTADEKTGMVFKDLAFLIKKEPEFFDQNLIADMQYFLVVCSNEFKERRSCRHIARLIAVQHLFRHSLRLLVKKEPQKRHIMLKLFRTRPGLSQESAATSLGVIVGMNVIKEREKFEKRHLLKAIQAYIPNVKVVEDSFQFLRQNSENVCTLYCEMEKEGGEVFTPQEVRQLRRELPKALEKRIEHLMHPVFMPRNEEEIYRNILMLGNQIKYLRDIPQVTITFDEQSQKHLYFTVILVRVLKTDDKPIQEAFSRKTTSLEYIHDRTQYVGSLRRKHKKEATVFRVQIAKDAFLRADVTIDLNKARQYVFNELSRLLGDLRDFNGGMIAKQNEVLKALQESLEKEKGYNELLLENFFYSLSPVILRNILETELLKALYHMLVEAVEDVADFDQSYSLKMAAEEDTVYVMIKTQERTLKDDLFKALSKLNIPSTGLASMYLSDYDVVYIGYIYRQHGLFEQRRFCQTIELALASWKLAKTASTHFCLTA